MSSGRWVMYVDGNGPRQQLPNS